MKLTWGQIGTATVAGYGALLSSLTFVLQLRSKRWRIATSYRLVQSQGRMPGVRFRADNVGERPVTLTDLMVGLGRRSSWTTKLARAVHPFNRLYGIDEMEGFGTYGGTPFLPKQVSPGASLFIELNGEEILNWVTSESKSGSPADRVVGIFYDDIGLSYPTPVMPVKILKDHVVKISPRKLAS